MTASPRFVPYVDKVCPRCGSILGAYDGREAFCPSPTCGGEGRLPPGIDASFLYRARALVFVPDPQAEPVPGCDEVGVILAVEPELVTSEVARRHAPVVVSDVCWPRDRARFSQLFDHHVHHVDGPLISPPNSGWDPTRGLPVL
jgi:hypothetical protein